MKPAVIHLPCIQFLVDGRVEDTHDVLLSDCNGCCTRADEEVDILRRGSLHIAALLFRDLPGENASGLSGQEVSRLPLETCETMNGMWGYKITDQNYKSTKTLIHYLVKAAGKNANLLMNIGPQPDGELPAVAVQRLAEMGEWMKQYGETIYGTRSGIVAPHDWGVTTQKGNKLYVHILDLKDAALFLPLTGKKVKKAVLFKDQSPVRFTKTKAGVLLEFAEVPKDIDYVVELTID